MSKKVRKIIFASVIAAMYVVLTAIFSPISYGPIQFRISEVLAILPYFFPVAVPGLYVGCIIANLLPFSYGLIDMLIGSTATLFAALITMRIGKSRDNETVSAKALALVAPVVINAVLIGLMIAFIMVGAEETDSFFAAFALNTIQIAFGQSIVLYLIGLPLMIYLPATGVIDYLKRIYEHDNKVE